MQEGKIFIVIVLFQFVFFVSSFGSHENSKDKTIGTVDLTLQKADSLSKSDMDSSISLINTYIDKNNPNKKETFQLYFKAGEINLNNQFYEAAENYFKKTLKVVDKIQNPDNYSSTLIELGRVHRRMGNYETALACDLEALSIIGKTGNKKKIAHIYNSIGLDHYRYKNFNEAILYFTQSLQFREEINDSIGIADSYNNLGMVYDEQGDKEKGLITYKKALKIFDILGELDGQAASYNNIAGIYYQQGQLGKVMEYMLRSLEIRKKEGNRRKISFIHLNIASVYFAMGKLDLAIIFNKTGLELAEQIGAKSQKKIAYQSLSEAYLEKENFEQAFYYHVLYSQVKDSIIEENKVRSMTEMQIKYESEKKEIENFVLKNENQVKSKNQFYLFIIALILVALLLIMFYSFRLRTKSHKQQEAIVNFERSKNLLEKKNLEDKIFAEKQINQLQHQKFVSDLKYKSDQLSNSTLSLINKNEVLSEIKSKVNSLADNGIVVSEIINFINQNLDMDNDWKKIKVEFEETHPQFFTRLHEICPEMSETYEKICSYIRISLTSREIAELLHVSQAAVNKNRQRLRKMLKLKPEADLGDFLKEL